MNDKKIVITIPMPSVPTNDFLKSLPEDVQIMVVYDGRGELKLGKRKFDVYDYGRQKSILGKFYKGFRVFHHSAACRNFAHYLSYKLGFESVISLDYDCKVPKTFLLDHMKALKLKTALGVSTRVDWINPLLSDKWYSRGFPYEYRIPKLELKFKKIKDPKIVLNMGLWKNVIDINGIDKIKHVPIKKICLKKDYLIARGNMPLSGMNNSFLREIIPAYLFLPNFQVGNWTVSRHDDIWGGYILEKLIEKRGDSITFGKPIVKHLRESYQPHVLYHEHYSNLMSFYFYNLVNRAVKQIEKSNYKKMYAEFTNQFLIVLLEERKTIPEIYFESFKYLHKSMLWWVNLFKKL